MASSGLSGMRKCVRNLTPYLVFMMSIITLGPLLFGFHLAELNAPEDYITCKKGRTTGMPKGATLIPCIPMDKAQFAFVSSIFTIGGLFGALLAGPVSTSFGRLPAMRISAIFYVLGSAITMWSASISAFATGRFLLGIGAGASVVVVPIYISEVAPPTDRGIFGFLTQIATNMGILITQILGYYLSYSILWRFILAAGGLIGLVLLFGLFLVPESPAWTAANRSPGRALATLKRLRGPHADVSEEIQTWDCTFSPSDPQLSESTTVLLEPESQSRRSSISTSSKPPPRAHVGIIAVALSPIYRPAIIAVVGVMCVQQFTGINSVMMYSVSVLTDLFPTSATLLTILISIVNLIATTASAPLPDILGRKSPSSSPSPDWVSAQPPWAPQSCSPSPPYPLPPSSFSSPSLPRA
ncbi:hypothetical protein GMDG_06819 [Pseudogymnoascus destructans 20631-21]|uniref:Major facilitator superfamily (MFS) profile domain-containing protein n=1 Tax=Pseudogymnoascus destructans (strain ATCC MYA-4855 / 20631-21) TaxID=658429 RepID=L8FVH9_PSED2|nr:hypothetical protein GMDG_06819 [Pseudogymnoascus destructans 20631-21]